MNNKQQTLLKARIESRLNVIRDLPEFKHVILEFIREFGFSDYCLSSLDIVDNRLDFTFSSLPGEFIDYYNEFELAQYDMMIDYLKWDTQPIFQKTIDDYVESIPYQMEATIKNLEIRAESERHQYYDFLVIPLLRHRTAAPGGNSFGGKRAGAEAFFALCCKGKNPTDFQRQATSRLAEIGVMANSFYSFGANKYPQLT